MAAFERVASDVTAKLYYSATRDAAMLPATVTYQFIQRDLATTSNVLAAWYDVANGWR